MAFKRKAISISVLSICGVVFLAFQNCTNTSSPNGTSRKSAGPSIVDPSPTPSPAPTPSPTPIDRTVEVIVESFETFKVYNSGGQNTEASCPADAIRVGCSSYCSGGKAGGYFVRESRACVGVCDDSSKEVRVHAHCARLPSARNQSSFLDAISHVKKVGEQGLLVGCHGNTIRTGCTGVCENAKSGGVIPIGENVCQGTCDASGNVSVEAICLDPDKAQILFRKLAITETGGNDVKAFCPTGYKRLNCSAQCGNSKAGGSNLVDDNGCSAECDDIFSRDVSVSIVCGQFYDVVTRTGDRTD